MKHPCVVHRFGHLNWMQGNRQSFMASHALACFFLFSGAQVRVGLLLQFWNFENIFLVVCACGAHFILIIIITNTNACLHYSCILYTATHIIVYQLPILQLRE